MRSKLVLIIAVALLLGSSVGVLATDLSQNGCPDQAALLAASPQLLPASAPAGRVAGAADAVAPAAPRAPRGVALCCRC